MEIKCPTCNKETTFNVTEAISCSHCQTSFQAFKFVKKAVVSGWLALGVAGYAGHKIDDWLEPNRYPVTIEYALIENCIKGRGEVGYQRPTAIKFELCACALEKTQKAFDFKRYKAEPSAFSAKIRAEALSCAAN